VTESALAALQERIGHTFADPSLLHRALTHPSYCQDHGGADYERLEFLGDSVLSFVVATHLFTEFPDLPEGALTRLKSSLSSGSTLCDAARDLRLGEALFLGRGSEREATRDSVLEDALEAVFGAAYLDGGLEVARSVIVRALGARLEADALLTTALDPKSELQELTQSRARGLPAYRIVERSGPPHAPVFTAEVHIAGALAGTGSGASKQAAQQAAAAEALKAL
jgi:ribonuclease-3